MYDYRSRADLERLSRDLHATASHGACAHIVAGCLFHRLMLPHWSMRPLIFVAKLRHGAAWQPVVTRALQTDRMRPALDQLWDQTLDHLVNGTDATNPQSAGGWNEQELATFVRLVLETDPASTTARLKRAVEYYEKNPPPFVGCGPDVLGI